jgi:hypothetical protein
MSYCQHPFRIQFSITKATHTGSHIFYTTDTSIQRTRILATETVDIKGNISCGGGIALAGAKSFYNTLSVNAGNTTNTFLSFRGTGLGND